MKTTIIGAGINGCYLAYRLGNAEVFEAKEKLGGKPCSGLISERIWDFIPRPIASSKLYNKLVKHEITEARIHFSIDLHLAHFVRDIILEFSPKMLVFDRQALDDYVGSLVSGKINFSERVEDFSQFDRVVGCDGANSLVRKKFSKNNPDHRLGVYCYTRERCDDHWVDCWPVKGGFAWKIPRGEDVEWGVIAPIGQAKKEFEKFIDKNNIKPDKIYSHVIPEGLCFVKNSKAVLCGDAAGLTKPWSGGGVIWGFTAADILAENMGNFQEYEKKLKSKFNNRIMLNRLARNNIWLAGLFPFKKIKFDADWGIF
jgi:digeranylgeranylglycerophospholipid reductase